ncbi:hypothetical protein ASPWEDRAFT_187263 [Aspergillus wentii DTO 134E9]|uniref:BTB domain-containing protein n=1 Tax=Aspergillus wentii DTO 134E9 TaxID=1073089 RepID=A0A1L9R8Y1_ASPWE|nr:uncharacterized protein ASPWEDRAFT_187263 [Aspergillus wentii DTO 134E9]OJJ31381.1 hypothetical protein ASPWEDRAFT_187263 [Aspergillus wentii DTO 134E9]
MSDDENNNKWRYVTFLVGEGHIPIQIHAAKIESMSPTLTNLMNDTLKKTGLESVPLDWVDTDTFQAFQQFAYARAYDTPSLPPRSYPGLESDSDVDDEEDEFGFDYPETDDEGLQHKFDFLKSCRTDADATMKFIRDQEEIQDNLNERLWRSFQDLRYDGSKVRPVPCADLSFHVKLYGFATEHFIEPLRQKCLKSLHRDLCCFPFHKKHVHLIADLLVSAYREDWHPETPLQKLVIHYVACYARMLLPDEQFQRALRRDEHIGADLLLKLVMSD